MQHLRLRCKHCQREYVYCTYGNGEEYGTEAGCSMHYCAECQKAIDEALAKIPVKFGCRRMEITPSKELMVLFKKVKDEQEKEAQKIKDGNRLPIIRHVPYPFPCSEYDNFDTCTYNGRTFTIEWNDDAPEKVRITLEMEYNFIENKFTDNYWRSEHKNGYTHSRPIKAEELHPVQPMSEPLGKLFYSMPSNWDITIREDRKPVRIPHERITYIRTYDGLTTRRILTEPGRGEKIAFQIDVEREILYPFMDYDIEYERYRDEDTETIINVKLHGLL